MVAVGILFALTALVLTYRATTTMREAFPPETSYYQVNGYFQDGLPYIFSLNILAKDMSDTATSVTNMVCLSQRVKQQFAKHSSKDYTTEDGILNHPPLMDTIREVVTEVSDQCNVTIESARMIFGTPIIGQKLTIM